METISNTGLLDLAKAESRDRINIRQANLEAEQAYKAKPSASEKRFQYFKRIALRSVQRVMGRKTPSSVVEKNINNAEAQRFREGKISLKKKDTTRVSFNVLAEADQFLETQAQNEYEMTTIIIENEIEVSEEEFVGMLKDLSNKEAKALEQEGTAQISYSSLMKNLSNKNKKIVSGFETSKSQNLGSNRIRDEFEESNKAMKEDSKQQTKSSAKDQREQNLRANLNNKEDALIDMMNSTNSEAKKDDLTKVEEEEANLFNDGSKTSTEEGAVFTTQSKEGNSGNTMYTLNVQGGGNANIVGHPAYNAQFAGVVNQAAAAIVGQIDERAEHKAEAHKELGVDTVNAAKEKHSKSMDYNENSKDNKLKRSSDILAKVKKDALEAKHKTEASKDQSSSTNTGNVTIAESTRLETIDEDEELKNVVSRKINLSDKIDEKEALSSNENATNNVELADGKERGMKDSSVDMRKEKITRDQLTNSTLKTGSKSNSKLRYTVRMEMQRNVFTREIDFYNFKNRMLFKDLSFEAKKFLRLDTLPSGLVRYVVNERAKLVEHAETDVVEKQSVAIQCETDTGFTDMQPEKAEELLKDQTLFATPSRQEINKMVKDSKYRKCYSKLLYFLRIKSFLKFRDANLMQQLALDARTWLQKNEYGLDNQFSYTAMASAVTVAFMVSDEEMIFRAVIKDSNNYDNMKHLNRTLKGNLGRSGVAERYDSLGRLFLKDLHLDDRNDTV